MAPVGRVFTVAEAAEYLHVSAESIKRAARSGQLAGYRDHLHQGGPWRFSRSDLDDYKLKRTRGSAD